MLPLALPFGDPVRLPRDVGLDALLPLLLALVADPADFLDTALPVRLCLALAGLDPGMDSLSGDLVPEVS